MNTRILCLAVALSPPRFPRPPPNGPSTQPRAPSSSPAFRSGRRSHGRFERFQAKIDFDPAKPEAGHAVVLIDLATARTGDVQRDEALPQKDWFDVKGANQARFEATRFIDKGHGDYEAVGTLTIRGTSRPLTLPFHLTLEKGQARVAGHVGLVRTDFGVGQGPWASGQWVGLNVGVDIDLVATTQPAPADGG